MFPTLQELILDVETELGLVSGSSVQTYSEPQIVANINKAFVALAEKRFWPHLTKTTQHVLDGSVGYVTDTNIGIQKVEDIEWIRYDPYYNTCNFQNLKGEEWPDDGGYYFDALEWDHADRDTKLIKFFPPSLNLNIKIRARRMPEPFALMDTIIPFDKIALSHFTTANVLATDGMNPNAERRQLILFDQRYKDIIGNEAQAVHYYGRSNNNTFTVAE